ncbi:hypothetical protein V6O07_13535, partial [Arthrospira platensis SPKY2]
NIDATLGEYNLWNLPSVATALGKIKLSSSTHPEVFAVSDTFRVEPNISITYPTSLNTTHLVAGETVGVNFYKPLSIDSVNIYYAKDGVNYSEIPINPSPVSQNTYSWVVDSEKTLTGKLKVEGSEDSRFVAESDPFEIKG